ncbi:uncharacterized protein IUM83_06946 [Phytophthora cinnamomi]|uniref:uncharacterized protein n=1 Tax=Phytophthora cinnamomi TaxID=4785 RepID=UPI003559FD84|nr:hypothetical protein IUM83_06946 [Phytophthora cinnamomi]
MAPPSQRLEEDFAAASAVPSRLFSASYFASELEKPVLAVPALLNRAREHPAQPSDRQIPIRATMAKPRQASAKILRSGVNAMRTVSSHAAEKASGLSAHAALRPAVTGLLMLALLALAVTSLGRFQLWMTGAGLFMVALSVASAVQEFKLPQTAQSYQDFLDKEMDKCGAEMATLPHVAPAQQQQEQQQQTPEDDVSAMALNIASPAIVSVSAPFPSSLQEKPSRRESEDSIGALESAINATGVETPARRNSSAEVSNKLDVLHCGTVIDIQGSHGFIIPHDLCMDARSASKVTRSGAVAGPNPLTKPHKMPLVIPFNLNEEQAEVRQEIAVGKTVEFAYSDSSDSPATVCAQNVTPVLTDDGIAKSRSALQSCKQAREVSFARAMEELTMISPRNVPVKHHVDLIKYAEKLDDHDAPFDQFI